MVPINGPEEKYNPIRGELVAQLLNDVQRLTLFAVQNGQLPDQINIDSVYQACSDWDQNKEITAQQLNMLANFYQILERHFPTITANSLAATEPRVPGRVRTSPVGRYLSILWIWTGLVVFVILASNLIQYIHGVSLVDPGEEWNANTWGMNLALEITQYLEPFLYGALGSFVYILRISETLLHTREFDPARAPEHINRLVLGSLSGGAIILFIGQVPAKGGGFLEIGAASLGFLAGYSVEFLIETLDRVVKAILPKVGLDTIQRSVRMKRDQEIIRRYQKKLDQAQDEGIKKILREMIDDIETR